MVHPPPSEEVQTTTSRSPAVPNVPTAVNPPRIAVTAVTVAGPRGDGSVTGRQVRPPSAETSANASRAAEGNTSVPNATTSGPLAATCCSSALAALPGILRVTRRQARPSLEVHTAGLMPVCPTAVNPAGPDVTPSTSPGSS